MLCGENFAPEPGPIRSDDLRKQREEFKRFQEHYDPRLNRELTPQEQASRDRVNAASEYWFNKYKQEQAEEAAERARRVAAQKARVDTERKARELQQRRAQFELNESLVDSMFDSHGATDRERAAVMNKLAGCGAVLTPENVWLELQRQRAIGG